MKHDSTIGLLTASINEEEILIEFLKKKIESYTQTLNKYSAELVNREYDLNTYKQSIVTLTNEEV